MTQVARITDLHSCPMEAPGVVKVPHVGGAIIGPGAPTVLVGGLPAALVGDDAVCVGPPATNISGSTSVLYLLRANLRCALVIRPLTEERLLAVYPLYSSEAETNGAGQTPWILSPVIG